MKKLIINMLLLFAITITAAAQANDVVPMANTPATQIENNNLIFNQSQNYNGMYRMYWVWDRTSASWVQRIEMLIPNPPAPNAGKLYNNTFESNYPVQNNTGQVGMGTKPRRQD